MNYEGLKFPKNPPARDRGYLTYVRQQICATYSNACQGRTEAAHLSVTGKSSKASDYLTIPLCSKHHRESHNVGIISFQLNHDINLWETACRLLARWVGNMK